MMDPSIDALWSQVESDWQREATHAAFLAYCRETGQLAEAACRYRALREDSALGEEARRRLAAVALMAESVLSASREPPRTLPRWFVIASVVFFGSLALYVLVQTLRL